MNYLFQALKEIKSMKLCALCSCFQFYLIAFFFPHSFRFFRGSKRADLYYFLLYAMLFKLFFLCQTPSGHTCPLLFIMPPLVVLTLPMSLP